MEGIICDDKETKRQTDRQTDKQTDREKERQTEGDTETDRQRQPHWLIQTETETDMDTK